MYIRQQVERRSAMKEANLRYFYGLRHFAKEG